MRIALPLFASILVVPTQHMPRVGARSKQLIALPHAKRHDDDTDRAFVASAIELNDGSICTCSVADQYCTRDVLRLAQEVASQPETSQ